MQSFGLQKPQLDASSGSIDKSRLQIDASTMPTTIKYCNEYNKPSSMSFATHSTPTLTPETLNSILREMKLLYMQLETTEKLFLEQIGPLDEQLAVFTRTRQMSQSGATAQFSYDYRQTPTQPSPTPQTAVRPPVSALNTQKTSKRRDTHHHKTTATKSSRHSERQSQSSQNTNPLDVWNSSQQFFQKLPTVEQAMSLFADIKPVNIPTDIPPSPVHWSEHFSKIAAEATTKNLKPLPPPGAPPAPDDRSEYWNRNNPIFTIEAIQMNNSSPLHCLLNALIESEPVKTSREKSKLFLRSHALLPQIAHHDYLQRPYADRLGFELSAIGLDPPEERTAQTDQPFAAEIASAKRKLETEIEPKLMELKAELEQKLPLYIADQQRRDENIAICRDLTSEALKAKNAKQKK